MAELVSKTTRIFLAGHTGLVGGSIYRTLRQQGFENILVRDFTELDLTDPAATRRFFDEERPEAVIDAAAKVGGIMANWEQPWEFVEQNLLIELNLIGEAFRHEVQRLVFLGSSCIYPREAPQPLKEEYLLTGPLEETNRAYAIAKIGGIELCRSLNREYGTDYLSLMPTNLYGPGDNFDLDVQPRAAGDDPQVPRGQGRHGGGRRRTRDRARPVGHRQAAPRVPVRGGRRPGHHVLPAERARGRRPGRPAQRGLRRGPHHPRARRPRPARRRLRGTRPVGRLPPRRHPAQAHGREPHPALGWAPEVGLEDGIRRTYDWFLVNHA